MVNPRNAEDQSDEYFHVGPLSFAEFLLATGRSSLAEWLGSWNPGDPLSESLHQELLARLREYFIIGGMPKSVSAWAATSRFADSLRTQEALWRAYADDFAKYQGKINPELLRLVLAAIPRGIGRRIKYASISQDHRAAEVARALRQLELARVLTLVRHSAAGGVPLGAEARDDIIKPVLVDTGLASASCGLRITSLAAASELVLVNNGAIAEQFVGQELLLRAGPWHQPSLYYWQREKATAAAELDYVVDRDDQVIPVEVRAGSSGRLRSLMVFMAEKKRRFAVRFNSDLPSDCQVENVVPGLDPVRFNLRSLPLYFAGEFDRLSR